MATARSAFLLERSSAPALGRPRSHTRLRRIARALLARLQNSHRHESDPMASRAAPQSCANPDRWQRTVAGSDRGALRLRRSESPEQHLQETTPAEPGGLPTLARGAKRWGRSHRLGRPGFGDVARFVTDQPLSCAYGYRCGHHRVASKTNPGRLDLSIGRRSDPGSGRGRMARFDATCTRCGGCACAGRLHRYHARKSPAGAHRCQSWGDSPAAWTGFP